jgi:hypothetical protein
MEVEYRYDWESKRYLRYAGEKAHWTMDLRGILQEQLAPANVIVLYAHHWQKPIQDPKYTHTLAIDLIGMGQALVLRDGRLYEVEWVREETDQMLTYWDAEGQPFPLKPGQTWVQVVPLDFEIELR